MFGPKKVVANVSDIPSRWIFEHYLELGEPLYGQNVRIQSIFRPHERVPSMFIYFNEESGDYRYKCFASGKGGNGIDLMMVIWDKEFAEASRIIIRDYENSNDTGKLDLSHVEKVSWKVKNFEIRSWTHKDAAFWSKYNISSDILDRYVVRPLKSYTMFRAKTSHQPEQSFTISDHNMYGYFTAEGELYKIYQPYSTKCKFLKVKEHLQGSQQCGSYPYLVIASSLKDIMSIVSLDLRVDLVAPDSENTVIAPKHIEHFKKNYKAVITLFDNDTAGIENMQKYSKVYNIPYCYFPYEKDVSDCIKEHDVLFTKRELIPRIQKALERYE